MPATVVTSDVINDSSVDMTTEKPYDEFTEVKAAHLIDRISLSIILSVGLVFNSLCFVTCAFTSLRTTSTCVYMAAIAVLDSCILIFSFCIILSRHLGNTIFYLHNDWTCGLNYFLFYFAIHFDVLVLLGMTVDRFIVVRFPLKAQSLCTPKSALRVITGVGIFSFALNFQIFFTRRLVPSGNPKDPLTCWYPAGEMENFMEKIYTIIDASVYSFIPFLSLLTLNLLIIKQLNQAHKFSKQFTRNRDMTIPSKARSTELKTDNVTTTDCENKYNNKDGGLASMRKSTASNSINVMFLLVSFNFLLLSSPVVIFLLYTRYYWQPRTNTQRAEFRLAQAIVDNIMFCNHAFNFLLYCISGRRFRQELKRLLARVCSRS